MAEEKEINDVNIEREMSAISKKSVPKRNETNFEDA